MLPEFLKPLQRKTRHLATFEMHALSYQAAVFAHYHSLLYAPILSLLRSIILAIDAAMEWNELGPEQLGKATAKTSGAKAGAGLTRKHPPV
ncbi:hypothetical protein [Hymenobacter sp. BT730]|uniref:hypothetical protein n=1 Tax=Hymenobacter sp. BT730 TaxID=3063332 RepID=UPI0026DFD504|nr:hypothetical protein [Hymenobacter sp. BT730]